MEKILAFPLEYQPRHRANALMIHVLIALLPGIAISIHGLGIGVLIQLLLASVVAISSEYLNLRLRKQALSGLAFSTALISAWLLALAIPQIAPWWVIVSGVLSGLWLGKYLFGGVGMNIFNPAMLGFCFVYLSFAGTMSNWSMHYVKPQIAVQQIFPNDDQQTDLPAAAVNSNDAIAGATPLEDLKLARRKETSDLDHYSENLFENLPNNLSKDYPDTAQTDASGDSQTTLELQIAPLITRLNLAWLLGGLYLLLLRIVDWRLSLGAFLGFFSLISLFYLAGHPLANPLSHPLNQLLHGATLLSLFFIVTDPSTAASSLSGRLIYAFLVGILAAILRQWSNMPDAWAFAILLGNLCVPLIDEHTKPHYGYPMK